MERGQSLLLEVWLLEKCSQCQSSITKGGMSQGAGKIHTGTFWQEPTETPGLCQAREIEDKGQRGCWFNIANITEISGNAISLHYPSLS